ncbi:Fic family protein, partial [Rubritalea halochordaticola]
PQLAGQHPARGIHQATQRACKGSINALTKFRTLPVRNPWGSSIDLDRASVLSSISTKIPSYIERKEEQAVQLLKFGLEHYKENLSHDMLYEMHRILLLGSPYPEKSIGAYTGDMQIISNPKLGEERIMDRGTPASVVHAHMNDFIDSYNRESHLPATKAIKDHYHFEIIHPFIDGNGRIGRTLMMMSLCKSFGQKIPFAISRAISQDTEHYYRMFEQRDSLNIEDVLRRGHKILELSIHESFHVAELTYIKSHALGNNLNPRQSKALQTVIKYELGKGFHGGLSNSNYTKITSCIDKTANRDLSNLVKRGLLFRTGQLKGTRYHLATPSKLLDWIQDKPIDVQFAAKDIIAAYRQMKYSQQEWGEAIAQLVEKIS